MTRALFHITIWGTVAAVLVAYLLQGEEPEPGGTMECDMFVWENTPTPDPSLIGCYAHPDDRPPIEGTREPVMVRGDDMIELRPSREFPEPSERSPSLYDIWQDPEALRLHFASSMSRLEEGTTHERCHDDESGDGPCPHETAWLEAWDLHPSLEVLYGHRLHIIANAGVESDVWTDELLAENLEAMLEVVE